ncbi:MULTISPECIES: DUF1684 domain-containing protein [Arenibacter]|uniref:DUF1684 domain-containing protein n=1 Tax=Arenibacter TaxID=178469 RepID=UPI001C07679B|nr:MULTISPECIES: DUF1684 domain-containing protein [Arenibacter]MBU2906007.1 DUF1684 domain-containing protein [Arenibacter algicola]MCK0134603.1 DUF1684 domain-containing protein [Arenibacter sp. S6351L]
MKQLFLVLFLLSLSCKEKRYHDQEEKNTVELESGAMEDIVQFQKKMNEEFKDPETSPLPDRFRKDFTTLDFYEPDTTYRIIAKFTRTPEALPFMMPTTTERQTEEVVFGIITFSLKGRTHKLEVYQNQELMQQEKYRDYLFLPFADLTNGEETYGGGRYLDLTIPTGDTILLDFNKAYNPYCAYNPKYSCPLVPKQNRLDIEITAGVKAFKKE